MVLDICVHIDRDIPLESNLNLFRFSINKSCLPNYLVDYIGKSFVDNQDPLQEIRNRAVEFKGKHLIIANEAFCPSGLRKDKVFRSLGTEWIKIVADVIHSDRPELKLWINDFRPRELLAWRHLRDYVKHYEVPIYGIGIQVHAQLNDILPLHYASPQNTPELLQYQISKIKNMGLQSAFTEVTCWSNNLQKRGDWYRKIYELAVQNELEFINFWSPTPYEYWHWSNKTIDCHLWDIQGSWLFNWALH